MNRKKIVVALGGNAILSTDASAEAQKAALKETAKYLIELVKQGNQLVISHGNGPQVGNLLLQQAAADSISNPAMPLDTCVAMTEGSIGYWLQNALQNQAQKQGLAVEFASVLTQVIVDEKDPAFAHPTKPVGPFVSEEEARQAMAAGKGLYVEDAGRGWRKVVPSPKPITIKESNVIAALTEQQIVTICTGGGGIPVIEKENELVGVEAVIDKDFASEKLAELIEADLYIILTGVDYVYVNYNQPNQQRLEQVTTADLNVYIDQQQFAPGSMLPKIQAAIEFVEHQPNGQAIITSLEQLPVLFQKSVGTVISK